MRNCERRREWGIMKKGKMRGNFESRKVRKILSERRYEDIVREGE